MEQQFFDKKVSFLSFHPNIEFKTVVSDEGLKGILKKQTLF